MSDTVMKEYIPVQSNGTKTTHLRVEVYYSLGGMNYWTYKNEARGYYLSVTPVERGVSAGGFVMEGFTAFSGTKVLVKEVKRKGKKAADEAVKLAEPMKQELIDVILKTQNLKVA